jgi:hypothetical protein
MDFAPMHPDVWATTDAERWNYYIQLRQAFEDGRDEVRDEFRSEIQKDREKAERDKKVKEFHKAHTGETF